MNKDHVKGAAEKAKGAVKDAAGGLTGDNKLQAEGKLDKAKGAVHTAVGDVKIPVAPNSSTTVRQFASGCGWSRAPSNTTDVQPISSGAYTM